MIDLRSLGDPLRGKRNGPDRPDRWRDYVAMGITAADAPALIAIATDKTLGRGPEPACYAPIHAWRALAQLRCEAAIRPLVDLLDYAGKSDDEWALEDVPEVLAMIGPAALPDLARTLPDQRRNLWARCAVATALARLADAHPQHRPRIVNALIDQLTRSRYNDTGFNANLVAELLDLKAAEALPTITAAYTAGDIDEDVCGSLEEVQAELTGTTSGTPDHPRSKRDPSGPSSALSPQSSPRAAHPPTPPQTAPGTSATDPHH